MTPERRAYNRECTRRMRERRKAAGECIACQEPVTGAHAYCDACLGDIRAALRTLRESRKAAGICTRCKAKAQHGRTLCASHHAADLASKRANPAARRGA